MTDWKKAREALEQVSPDGKCSHLRVEEYCSIADALESGEKAEKMVERAITRHLDFVGSYKDRGCPSKRSWVNCDKKTDEKPDCCLVCWRSYLESEADDAL